MDKQRNLLSSPFILGTLLKRYKRFFADILLDDGSEITAHCPNSGAMLGVLEAGNRVAVTAAENPLRKLKYTWQYVCVNETWIGINTHLTNEIVADSLEKKLIPELRDYTSVAREIKYGTNCRIDFLLTEENLPPCYLEVKNAHLKRGEIAQFPDCVTARGAKHLTELAKLRQKGMRCVVLYLVQRSDCTEFCLAEDIDPAYGKASELAKTYGVEMLAFAHEVSVNEGAILRQGNLYQLTFSQIHKVML